MIVTEEMAFKICACDHAACGQMLRSDRDIAWRMYTIAFGVHPETYRTLGKPVFLIQGERHFCHLHRDFYKEIILALMNNYCDVNKMSASADFKSGIGCWITLIDVLGGHREINFQMPYDMFENICRSFFGMPLYERHGYQNAGQREALSNLQK